MASVASFPLPVQARFYSNFESGNVSEWDATSTSGAAPVPICQQNVVRQGAYAMQAGPCSLNNYRSEVTNDSRIRFWMKDGDEWYFGFSMYLPHPFPNTGTFQVPWQLHQDNTSPGSVPVTLYINGDPAVGTGQRGEIHIGGGGGGNASYPHWSQKIMDTVEDQWIDMVIFVKGSTTIGTGYVSVWVNDVVRVNKYFPSVAPTIYPDGQQYNYHKCGYYRDANISSTNVIYHDIHRYGQTYAQVAPSGVTGATSVTVGMR